MFIRHLEDKICPKCKKKEVYRHASDLIYFDDPFCFRCHYCNWEWGNANGEEEGRYYEELRYEDIKIDPSKPFHEKNNKWKWIPFLKREAKEKI